MTPDELDRPLQAVQNEILELIARGTALQRVANRLCHMLEELVPETVCAVSQVEDGLVRVLSAPSLPPTFVAALDGTRVGLPSGSCGAAAARGEAVLVENIATDPVTIGGPERALAPAFKACWSSPIKAREGSVVGTFTLYLGLHRGPTPLERRAVETCVHLCLVAIESARTQARYHRLAYFDTLTDLPNRLHAEEITARAFAAAPGRLALLLVDIDNLKVTNDTLGHDFGDALIKHVAGRLAEGTRGGTACRLGGDEFLVVLENVVDRDALASVARRIQAVMEVPFTHSGIMLHPQVTVGGARMNAAVADANVLRQNADIALYHAKEHRRGGFVEFTEDLRASMTIRTRCIRETGLALNEERIVPFYQPVCCTKTGRILAFEALARMITPDGQVVAAGSFAEAFRDARIARRVTRTVMTRVAADMSGWMRAGLPPAHVGINVTAADWQGDDLADILSTTFGARGVPLDRVSLEGTEAVVVGHLGRVSGAMTRIRSLGSMLVLDGFGTGYASMTHLLTYPIDVIKIDRAFVSRLCEPKAKAMVAAMIDIARALGIHVVAGGIETAHQARELAEMGCLFGQGYYFHRPADADTTTWRLSREASIFSAAPCAHAPTSRMVA